MKTYLTLLLLLAMGVSGQAASLENVFSCAMMDGNLSHQLYKKDSNDYVMHIALPLYHRMPSNEALEKSKEAWKKWDGEGPMPKDPRQVAVAIPLESANVISFDLKRLAKKSMIFEKVFPPAKSESHVDYNVGRLMVDFKANECEVAEKEGLVTAFCQNSQSVLIGDTWVQEVNLRMGSQRKQELVVGEDGQALMSESLQVRVDLILMIDNQYVRSTFVYEPNGNDRQCYRKDRKLSAQ